jgi:hypothetical protein
MAIDAAADKRGCRARSAFAGRALNLCVELLAIAHQVGLGGTPSPDTPAAQLRNLQ